MSAETIETLASGAAATALCVLTCAVISFFVQVPKQLRRIADALEQRQENREV